MHITKLRIEGFKAFRAFELSLNEHLNIIVGDNETGKTTLLEAIQLVMSCQLDGRNIQYDIDPYIFNTAVVQEYFAARKAGEQVPPPHILIEAFFDNDGTPETARLRGTNNSLGENSAGLYLKVELNVEFAGDLQSYVASNETPDILPVEFYTVAWRSFADADNPMHSKRMPFRARVIDTSLTRGRIGPNKYLLKTIGDALDESGQQHSLALAYRKLKHLFMNEDGIKSANEVLNRKKGDVTDKELTVSMDMSARSTWDRSITAHLDDIPFALIGKGEQCRVQMKLAMESAADSKVLLIEEPENHLSHANMRRLLQDIASRADGRQIVLTTHSSFVLNKLGMNNLKLLSGSDRAVAMTDLSHETQDYFLKLPGYDTLRLILSPKAILVEGPSDELVVQKAYLQENGKLPLDGGVDVISVRGLSFKRFLEIAKLLNLDVTVVTDNDGSVAKLKDKYEEYLDGKAATIRICFSDDETCKTLEPQLLKANSLGNLNRVFGTEFASDAEILTYMADHKTDVALKVFAFDGDLKFPEYIRNAIQ